MAKRKGSFKEPENLKRFKSLVDQFNSEHKTEWGAIHVSRNRKNRFTQKRVHGGQTRKERRKTERKLKKMRKHAHFEKKKLPTMESLIEEKKAARRTEQKKNLKKNEKKKNKQKTKEDKYKVASKEETDKTRVEGLLEANKNEDRNIKQLEKQLGLKKRKSSNMPLSFRNDGLDYLLEAVDKKPLPSVYTAGEDGDSENEDGSPKTSWDVEEDEESMDSEEDFSGSEEGTSESGSDIPEDLSVPEIDANPDKNTVGILKKSQKKTASSKKAVSFHNSDTDSHDSGEEIDTSELDEDGNLIDSESPDNNKSAKEENPKASKSKRLSNQSVTKATSESSTSSKLKEDIYGRLRDSEGKVYVPPGRRKQMSDTEDSKKRQKLEKVKKMIKGLLNRLSEANLQSVSGQVEELYRGHSRMDVTETLIELVMAACISPVPLPERLVMEHAMLVAILHGNVGSEVGAYLLQCLAVRFRDLTAQDGYGDTKEIDNLLVLLAHLYNFSVVHCQLLFDITKGFTDNFKEKDIEMLLLLLKNVGFTLRKDDPVLLKDTVVKIQSKASDVDTSGFQDQSRVRFMLDVLLAIKNNNMRKIPNYDPSHRDHLRKLLRQYVKDGKMEENRLRISLSDLLEASTKGRWWLVGSAWQGRSSDTTRTTETPELLVTDASAHILDLARQQRMNTAVRKNIFCIIMTCEDFVDCFEKLLRLGLKHQQEREIVHVTFDLCVQEKTFNPFYALLTQKFCEYDRRFQMTTQFLLWDKFRELEQLREHKLNNMAAFLTHLLVTRCLSLSVFKVIEFSELDKPRVRFLKRVLTTILTEQPDHVLRDIFSRISTLPKLHVLCEGLRLFMTHFLLKRQTSSENPTGSSATDHQGELLEGKVQIAEKALCSADSRMLL